MALSKKDIKSLKRYIEDCDVMDVMYLGYVTDHDTKVSIVGGEKGYPLVIDTSDWQVEISDFMSMEFDASTGTVSLETKAGDCMELVGYNLGINQDWK